MDFQYKLTMFGFPALCEDMDEVLARIKQIPPERALAETLEQCYLIDLKTGETFYITCNNGKYVIDFNKTTPD